MKITIENYLPLSETPVIGLHNCLQDKLYVVKMSKGFTQYFVMTYGPGLPRHDYYSGEWDWSTLIAQDAQVVTIPRGLIWADYELYECAAGAVIKIVPTSEKEAVVS
jgi:hypothetical protein